jgi:hypothetical protein
VTRETEWLLARDETARKGESGSEVDQLFRDRCELIATQIEHSQVCQQRNLRRHSARQPEKPQVERLQFGQAADRARQCSTARPTLCVGYASTTRITEIVCAQICSESHRVGHKTVPKCGEREHADLAIGLATHTRVIRPHLVQ